MATTANAIQPPPSDLLQIGLKKGDTLAEVTLADLYIYGDGVAQDCVQGKSLLAEAAKNGTCKPK